MTATAAAAKMNIRMASDHGVSRGVNGNALDIQLSKGATGLT
jgi:hypothetical protein